MTGEAVKLVVWGENGTWHNKYYPSRIYTYEFDCLRDALKEVKRP